MNDTKNPEPEDDGTQTVDAFVILHTPADGGEPYAIGPYPPIIDLAKMVLEGTKCTCDKAIIEVAFPAGVRMVLAIDTDLLADIAAAKNALVN